MKTKQIQILTILLLVSISVFSQTYNGVIWNIIGPNAGAWDLVNNVQRWSTNPDSLKDMKNTDGVGSWTAGTGNGTLFVKNNSFAYASPIVENAIIAFSSGTPSQYVSNPSVNDIYIAKIRGGSNYVVIKITNINVTSYDNLDNIEFEYKKNFPQGCPDIVVVNNGIDYITICKGTSYQLDASSLQNAVYSWSPSTNLSNPNIYNPIVSPDTSTKYIVSMQYSTCPTLLDSITIIVKTPIGGFIYNTYQSVVTFMDTTSTAYSWSWDFGDPNSGSLNTSTSQNPTHIYSSAGAFTVILTVHTNNFPCYNYTLTNNINITGIDEITLEKIKIYPNPIIDKLVIDIPTSILSDKIFIKIFDIKGIKVFEIVIENSITEINNLYLTNGTYFYQILNDKNTILKNGTILKN